MCEKREIVKMLPVIFELLIPRDDTHTHTHKPKPPINLECGELCGVVLKRGQLMNN